MSDPSRPFPRSWVIAKAKVVDYLLAPNRTRGIAKARFFAGFGFSVDLPDELAEHRNASQMAPTDPAQARSVKIVFEGPIASPDGCNPHVRTVWRADVEGVARFITAVPLKRPPT